MQLTLPIILTLGRILLIPILVLFFYLPWRGANEACTVIFALAAITDWLDGYAARRMNQVSRFGAFLDPVADKLMVCIALVLLVQQNPGVVFTLAASIIIGREITITALREWFAELGQRGLLKVGWVSKVKTTVQMIAILLLLYSDPILGLPIQFLGELALALSAALTLWTMVTYLRVAWPILTTPAYGTRPGDDRGERSSGG